MRNAMTVYALLRARPMKSFAGYRTCLRFGLGTLLLLELPACMTRDSRPVQYAELRHRAAFDFRCNERDIQITPLKEDGGSSCTTEFHYASSAGATCREQQATYLYSHRTSEWVMNNDSKSAR